MGFDYRKAKIKDDSGVQWTSYSDLFMSLSIIFLLLYVTASLRQGTTSLQQNLEHERLTRELTDLKQQIKVYNTLKEDYLENSASREDQKVYEDLMSRLSLLQDQAKDEKDQLRQKALENEKKETALNQYQKLIRNIINSNVISKARVKRRDIIIEKKDDIISQKFKEVRSLEATVNEKKRIIAKGEQTIASINGELQNRMGELERAYQNQEITKKKLDTETARLKEESAQRVSSLRTQNEQMVQQLSDASGKLVAMNTQLENAKGTIQKQDEEKSKLQKELELSSMKYTAQMEQLNREFESQRARDRANFERTLRQHKLTAAARAEKEAAFKAETQRKADEMGQRVAALNAKMKDTQQELQKASAQANARKMLANEIRKNFTANGVQASVDPNTGDVILDFHDQYFDTGRADLKPGMRQLIEKAMPIYSQSLLGNKKISSKITSVEITGFASPTYKGKYVDPQTLSPGDRSAVDFNLDLSYARARAIFRHIFDTNKMTFRYQRELLPLVKVTGRSFLAERKSDRNISSGMSQGEFCEHHDCVKAQKVIIKFNLEE